jgi:predicted homoserine dehydrogenase-like protein
VDYTVGVPWPGGGVYIVGESHDDDQHFLLDYYKVSHKRPYYLFFRPYHLCHLETPRAIAQCYFDARPVIAPSTGKMLNDVYAYAKTDLAAGTIIGHAIGGDEIYGQVNEATKADADHNVPVYWFEHQEGKHAVLNVAKKQDEPIRWQDVTIPETKFHALLKAQQALGA